LKWYSHLDPIRNLSGPPQQIPPPPQDSLTQRDPKREKDRDPKRERERERAVTTAMRGLIT